VQIPLGRILGMALAVVCAAPAAASGQGDGHWSQRHAPVIRRYHHGWGATPYAPWPHGGHAPQYAPRRWEYRDPYGQDPGRWRRDHGRRRYFDHHEYGAPHPYPRGELYFRFP
jgi:hypothetical protein